PGFADRWPLAHPDASHLPGLLASGVRIRRDLNLSGTVVTGAHSATASISQTAAIWLTEAEIGGRFIAHGTSLEPDRGRAVQADRTRVAGDIRLVHGFRSTGEIRLIAVDIGGSLDLTSATLGSGTGVILDDPDPDLGLRPRLRGRLELARATIGGRVLIRRA